jgi:hypothetical protein
LQNGLRGLEDVGVRLVLLKAARPKTHAGFYYSLLAEAAHKAAIGVLERAMPGRATTGYSRAVAQTI